MPVQVGALRKAKEVLREVVQLPLQQPALFAKGSLARPTKGILLFGPPGMAPFRLPVLQDTAGRKCRPQETVTCACSAWQTCQKGKHPCTDGADQEDAFAQARARRCWQRRQQQSAEHPFWPYRPAS